MNSGIKDSTAAVAANIEAVNASTQAIAANAKSIQTVTDLMKKMRLNNPLVIAIGIVVIFMLIMPSLLVLILPKRFWPHD